MNKILTALIVAGCSYYSASAQTSQVCRMSPDKKKTSCYNTSYAQNFKVCKDGYGYRICDEQRNGKNSTTSALPVDDFTSYQTPAYNYDNVTARNTEQPQKDMIAPQSMSYPAYPGANRESSFEGYYPKRHYIKVCYWGDDGAEDAKAPYKGCPSPQDDGPDKNGARNINANSAQDLPPIDGRGFNGNRNNN